jgi:hypothetical protein
LYFSIVCWRQTDIYSFFFSFENFLLYSSTRKLRRQKQQEKKERRLNNTTLRSCCCCRHHFWQTSQEEETPYYTDGRCVSGHSIQLDAEERKKIGQKKRVSWDSLLEKKYVGVRNEQEKKEKRTNNGSSLD